MTEAHTESTNASQSASRVLRTVIIRGIAGIGRETILRDDAHRIALKSAEILRLTPYDSSLAMAVIQNVEALVPSA